MFIPPFDKKNMKYVFELKCYENGLGRYNATEVYTIFIVCENAKQAIKSVLKNETITVEVVSYHQCIILE